MRNSRWALAFFPSLTVIASTVAGTGTDLPEDKPIHEMADSELLTYMGWLRNTVTEPSERLARVAIRSVGQPYCFGSSSAMFDHRKSDCVTFVEHSMPASF